MIDCVIPQSSVKVLGLFLTIAGFPNIHTNEAPADRPDKPPSTAFMFPYPILFIISMR
jgi:hypothetical protein